MELLLMELLPSLWADYSKCLAMLHLGGTDSIYFSFFYNSFGKLKALIWDSDQ